MPDLRIVYLLLPKWVAPDSRPAIGDGTVRPCVYLGLGRELSLKQPHETFAPETLRKAIVANEPRLIGVPWRWEIDGERRTTVWRLHSLPSDTPACQ